MNTAQIVVSIFMGLFFLMGVVHFVTRAEEDDCITPPKHVPMVYVDAYTAQEVYDWVVYVTKVTGTEFLEQMTWDVSSRHNFMLGELSAVIHITGKEAMMKRLEEIGDIYGLETDIVDAPY